MPLRIGAWILIGVIGAGLLITLDARLKRRGGLRALGYVGDEPAQRD